MFLANSQDSSTNSSIFNAKGRGCNDARASHPGRCAGPLTKLWMLQQCFPGFRREARLPVERLPHRFGTGRTVGALEPAAVQWLLDELDSVGGDGSFFFFAGRVSCPDEDATKAMKAITRGLASALAPGPAIRLGKSALCISQATV